MPDVVTFDPLNLRIIEIDTGDDNELDWQEIYSEWKAWAILSDNLKYPPAFRVVGGDEIDPISGQALGITHFITNRWKLRPAEHSHRLLLTGNIFTDPSGESPVVPTLGTYTVLVEGFVSNLVDSSVARLDLAQLQEAVYIDTDGGEAGTDVGIGTPTRPVDNIADAFAIADRDNLRAFSIVGDVTLDRAVMSWSFSSTVAKTSASLDFNGYVCTTCAFHGLTLTGDAGGSDLFVTDSAMVNLTNVTGVFKRSGLTGLMTPGSDSKTTLVSCFSDVPGAGTPVLDLADQAGDDLQVRAYAGGLQLSNVDIATQDVSVDMVSGHLVLDATCIDGTVVLRGVGKLTDLSSGSLVLNRDGFIEGVDVTGTPQRVDDLSALIAALTTRVISPT